MMMSRYAASLLALSLLALSSAACTAPDADSQGYDQTEVVRLDPTRSYDDRLELLDRLERAHPMPEGWVDARDGLRVQTAWQQDSGRGDPDENGTLKHWWGNGNWTLSVWQMQVLQQERGEFSNIDLVRWKDYEPTQKVTDTLLAYYDAVDASHRLTDLSSAAQHLETHELQRLMWEFHVAAIESALAQNEEYLEALPDGERDFATSFGVTMVDLFAVVNMPTDGGLLGPLADMTMPDRLVIEDDYDLTIDTDLPWDQRLTIIAIDRIHSFEQWTNGLLRKALGVFVKGTETAELATHLVLEAMQEDSPGRFLWWALRNHSPEHNSLPGYDGPDGIPGFDDAGQPPAQAQ